VPEVDADRRPLLSLHGESLAFGHRLRILRAALDFSQADMGAELDITGQNVGRIEAGAAKQISIHTLFCLMDYLRRLGLDMGWFTSDTARVPTPSLRHSVTQPLDNASPAPPAAGGALAPPDAPAAVQEGSRFQVPGSNEGAP
jgi:transcriptional regulator with XRE-family HTH domain